MNIHINKYANKILNKDEVNINIEFSESYNEIESLILISRELSFIEKSYPYVNS